MLRDGTGGGESFRGVQAVGSAGRTLRNRLEIRGNKVAGGGGRDSAGFGIGEGAEAEGFEVGRADGGEAARTVGARGGNADGEDERERGKEHDPVGGGDAEGGWKAVFHERNDFSRERGKGKPEGTGRTGGTERTDGAGPA